MDAFAAVGLEDLCSVSEIEELLFGEEQGNRRNMTVQQKAVFDRIKETNEGETICLSYEQAKTLVDWIDELEKGEIKE